MRVKTRTRIRTTTENFSSFLKLCIKILVYIQMFQRNPWSFYRVHIEQVAMSLKRISVVWIYVVDVKPHALHVKKTCKLQNAFSVNVKVKRYYQKVFSIKYNCFDIGPDHILGTTRITKFSPPGANIFIAGLKQTIFQWSNFQSYIRLRCLDDIFVY